MIGPLGRSGPAATLLQHRTQTTRRRCTFLQNPLVPLDAAMHSVSFRHGDPYPSVRPEHELLYFGNISWLGLRAHVSYQRFLDLEQTLIYPQTSQ